MEYALTDTSAVLVMNIVFPSLQRKISHKMMAYLRDDMDKVLDRLKSQLGTI